MSDRDLRESTKKVTSEQKRKSDFDKEIKKSKDISTKLQNIRRQEEKLYLDSAIELAEYSVQVYDNSDEETAVGGEVNIPQGSSQLNETFDAQSNPVVEDWDPLGVAITPRKVLPSQDTNTQVEPVSATWSTGVNQFFPLNCDSSPVLQRKNILSIESDLPSPSLRLEEIIEENEDTPSSFDNNTSEEQVGDTGVAHPITDKMEEQAYNLRLASVKKEVVKIHLRIDEFTPDAVNIIDKDTFKNDLDEIRKEFRLTRDKIYELITDLDPNADEDRITHLKFVDKDMADKFKANDIAVKDKMVQLITAAEVDTATATKQKEDKSAEIKKQRLVVRMNHHLKKTKALKETIEALTDCKDMSEQEIRKNLLESKNWEKKVDDLTSVKETIDEDIVSLDVDGSLKAEVEDEFDLLVESVQNKIKELKLLDTGLGLHTLAPSKVKENVVYPKYFNGLMVTLNGYGRL